MPRFWVDRALCFGMRQARHLRSEHPTFVTHFNREDQRSLIVHTGRYKGGDFLRHRRSPGWDGRQLSALAPPSWDLLMRRGWPLALMLSADKVPILRTHSSMRLLRSLVSVLCISRRAPSWPRPSE